MFNFLKSISCLCLTIISANAAPADRVHLTGIMVFSCDENGYPDANFVWDNRGLDSDFYKLWVADGASGHFLNGPTWEEAPVSLPLKPEDNKFTLFLQGIGPWDYFAINLFLDGSPVPQISAMAPMRTSEAIPPISPNNAQITYSLTSYPLPDVAAAGTTTANLARPVELTEFSMADPGLFNLDLVDSHEIGSNGEIDFVASLTLAVGHKN